jgi:hypothetical protein
LPSYQEGGGFFGSSLFQVKVGRGGSSPLGSSLFLGGSLFCLNLPGGSLRERCGLLEGVVSE